VKKKEESMYLQEMLEIAIGLVFVWFVISMFAMTIQEWISSVLNQRAKNLEVTIIRLLDDPEYERGLSVWWRKIWSRAARQKQVVDYEKSLTKAFYNHRLIRVLSQPRKLPSYISVGKFTDVLFDILLDAGTDASILQSTLIKVRENLNFLVTADKQEAAKETLSGLIDLAGQVAQTNPGVEAVEKLRAQVDLYTQNYPAVRPLIDSLLTIAPPDQPVSNTLQRMTHGIFIVGAQNEHLRESLTPIILDVQKYISDKDEALAKARQNVESWFNETMDRVSGVYKRRAQVVAFMVGLFLALLVNIDSVGIAESLWREPTLRQALVAKADLQAVQGNGTAATSQNPVADLQDKLQELNLPVGWMVFSNNDPAVALCKWNPTPDRTDGDRFGIQLPSIQSLGDIKSFFAGTSKIICISPTVNANLTSGWIWFLGILITAGAAAQGAPFWFEILGKLVNVRSAGIKPDDKGQKKG
jgi:hypothetical protein